MKSGVLRKTRSAAGVGYIPCETGDGALMRAVGAAKFHRILQKCRKAEFDIFLKYEQLR